MPEDFYVHNYKGRSSSVKQCWLDECHECWVCEKRICKTRKQLFCSDCEDTHAAKAILKKYGLDDPKTI